MPTAPEPRTDADAFADSVKLASLLKAGGLPVRGARHDGASLSVGFATPREATAQISVPVANGGSGQPQNRIRRARRDIIGHDGGL